MIHHGITVIMMLLCLPSLAFAHDLWLQPDAFQIGLNSLLVVRLLTGHLLKAQKEFPLEKKMMPRLQLFSRNRQIDILTQSPDGQSPLIEYTADFEGQGLVTADKSFTTITLTAEQFRKYLESEYNTGVIAHKTDAEQRTEEKERYARCMKTLVQTDSASECYDVVTGQKLEIILKTNPFQCGIGEKMEFRVLFDNNPLKNKTVKAYRSDSDGQTAKLTATTDQTGSSFFVIDQPGVWLIRLVHLYPCPAEDEMDWESYWASYCFEIPA